MADLTPDALERVLGNAARTNDLLSAREALCFLAAQAPGRAQFLTDLMALGGFEERARQAARSDRTATAEGADA